MDLDIVPQTIDALADEARAIACKYFSEPPSMEQKADRTPVTQADRDIEAALVAAIRRRFPEHDIIGEEYGAQSASGAPPSADRFTWIIDPVDGTGSFAIGSPLFGTLIGVLRNGVPWVGAIEMPILSARWIGSPAGSFLNGLRVATSSCDNLAKGKLCTTSPDIFDRQGRQAFERVASQVALRRYGGDCHNYALLATGRVDLVIESGLQFYDYLPLVPVIEAAGGVITDWEGRPLRRHSDGRVIASANQQLHRQALALLGV
ncbi:histidinol phosphate phosphatase [Burkholderia sp. Bp8963]|uniref:inositol monophosphatase family protein n=1 Tax=Burkholderia sp. Bp8963 TaxID=2184547 RepID=UPI000F590D95|nr:inositol monophosphatase family protein [Burkholderia sp. Bp8963]RQS62203.1 histidinol phosphate phosphatase [Burkholderia sp. Bp8963]